MSIILRRVAVAVALVAVAAGTSRAQDTKGKLDPGQQADIRAMVLAVDDVTSGKPAPSTLPVKWAESHYIKAQADKTYVPFILDIDSSGLTAPAHLALYLRVAQHGDTELGSTPPPPPDPKKKGAEASPDGRHQFTFEDVSFFDVTPVAGQPAYVSRAFAVPPGDYDVYVALEDRSAEAPAAGAPAATTPATAPAATAPAAETAAPKMGVVKQELSVPDLQGAELTTSSVIVAEKVDVLQAPLSADRQADNPYTFGQMKITPATSGTFTKKDDLNVIFWIYGAQPDPATKKPNVTVEYSFNRKTADGETYFNRTDPQDMNASTLPPQFDLAAGHQLPGSLQVPLGSFPAGDYHLQIKVTDKVSSKSIARDVNFTVAAEPAQQ
jgi:hypothetical protein